MENEEKKEEIVVKRDEDLEIKKEEKKKKHFFRMRLPRIPFSLFLLVLLVCVAAILFLLSKDNFKTKEKVTKLGLEDVGELVTQTCHTVVLESSYTDRKFFELFTIPFTESQQIFSYDFDVEASLNFEDIKISKIDDDNKVIELKLPHAKARNPIILLDSFVNYLDKESPFSRITMEQNNEAKKRMGEKATKSCLDNKLIESADSNAQRLINAFIKSNDTYKDYNIEFIYEGSSEDEER